MSKIELANKNVVVLGMGLTGLSCVRFLLAKGANVIAMDRREELIVKLDVPLILGEFDQYKMAKADLVVVSPGVDLNTPAIQFATAQGVNIVGDIELFAQFNTRPVIAITGSNGKSTVTHLVTEMCLAAGKKALMGGNIGVPALDLLEQDADIFILELSSFQLETTFSLISLAATVLNVTEDHLDRHGDMTNYKKIKWKIFQNHPLVAFNRDDAESYPIHLQGNISFGLSASVDGFSWDEQSSHILFNGQKFIDSQTCLLVGQHNMLNIQAAAALAKLAGISDGGIKQGARSFGGLPHRCETVFNINGVRWINDSKATNVGATLAAIKGLLPTCKGRLVLIAGGEGKGADFSPLKECLQESIDLLITLGKDGDKIAALKTATQCVVDLHQAVKVATQFVQEHDVVLLSPACASLDMFANYQERGTCFVRAVAEVAG